MGALHNSNARFITVPNNEPSSLVNFLEEHAFSANAGESELPPLVGSNKPSSECSLVHCIAYVVILALLTATFAALIFCGFLSPLTTISFSVSLAAFSVALVALIYVYFSPRLSTDACNDIEEDVSSHRNISRQSSLEGGMESEDNNLWLSFHHRAHSNVDGGFELTPLVDPRALRGDVSISSQEVQNEEQVLSDFSPERDSNLVEAPILLADNGPDRGTSAPPEEVPTRVESLDLDIESYVEGLGDLFPNDEAQGTPPLSELVPATFSEVALVVEESGLSDSSSDFDSNLVEASILLVDNGPDYNALAFSEAVSTPLPVDEVVTTASEETALVEEESGLSDSSSEFDSNLVEAPILLVDNGPDYDASAFSEAVSTTLPVDEVVTTASEETALVEEESGLSDSSSEFDSNLVEASLLLVDNGSDYDASAFSEAVSTTLPVEVVTTASEETAVVEEESGLSDSSSEFDSNLVEVPILLVDNGPDYDASAFSEAVSTTLPVEVVTTASEEAALVEEESRLSDSEFDNSMLNTAFLLAEDVLEGEEEVLYSKEVPGSKVETLDLSVDNASKEGAPSVLDLVSPYSASELSNNEGAQASIETAAAVVPVTPEELVVSESEAWEFSLPEGFISVMRTFYPEAISDICVEQSLTIQELRCLLKGLAEGGDKQNYSEALWVKVRRFGVERLEGVRCASLLPSLEDLLLQHCPFYFLKRFIELGPREMPEAEGLSPEVYWTSRLGFVFNEVSIFQPIVWFLLRTISQDEYEKLLDHARNSTWDQVKDLRESVLERVNAYPREGYTLSGLVGARDVKNNLERSETLLALFKHGISWEQLQLCRYLDSTSINHFFNIDMRGRGGDVLRATVAAFPFINEEEGNFKPEIALLTWKEWIADLAYVRSRAGAWGDYAGSVGLLNRRVRSGVLTLTDSPTIPFYRLNNTTGERTREK
ncbi:DUF1389 domain-containing protein [Chlamydia vaughanii]|uniref:DUF1389 domain-containing protein n=1 Tax=Chlamydia vaughanii TaxID=3112552 RepID=UPI0032B1135A